MPHLCPVHRNTGTSLPTWCKLLLLLANCTPSTICPSRRSTSLHSGNNLLHSSFSSAAICFACLHASRCISFPAVPSEEPTFMCWSELKRSSAPILFVSEKAVFMWSNLWTSCDLQVSFLIHHLQVGGWHHSHLKPCVCLSCSVLSRLQMWTWHWLLRKHKWYF